MDLNSLEEKSSSEKRPCPRSIGVANWVVLGILALCLLYLTGSAVWAGWDEYAYKQVESSEDSGYIIGATYTSSFALNATAIRTTTGTYVCRGFMQAVDGHRVRIEKRRNGERALCDVETGVCLKMLGR